MVAHRSRRGSICLLMTLASKFIPVVNVSEMGDKPVPDEEIL